MHVSPVQRGHIVSPVALELMATESVKRAVFHYQELVKVKSAIHVLLDAIVWKDARRLKAVDYVQLERSFWRVQVLTLVANLAVPIRTRIPLVHQHALYAILQMAGILFQNLRGVKCCRMIPA